MYAIRICETEIWRFTSSLSATHAYDRQTLSTDKAENRRYENSNFADRIITEHSLNEHFCLWVKLK